MFSRLRHPQRAYKCVSCFLSPWDMWSKCMQLPTSGNRCEAPPALYSSKGSQSTIRAFLNLCDIRRRLRRPLRQIIAKYLRRGLTALSLVLKIITSHLSSVLVARSRTPLYTHTYKHTQTNKQKTWRHKIRHQQEMAVHAKCIHIAVRSNQHHRMLGNELSQG